MTRPKAVTVVSVIAIVFAGLAAWLTYSYLQSEISSVQAVQPERIVVAASDIPIGSLISPQQLKISSWPRDSIPPGSAQTADAVVSRVAIRPIAQGDAITEQKLKPKSASPGSGFMTYVVPQGHRAVTVAVNEVAGVAGFLTPGDRVDVIVTIPVPGNEKESVSKIALENVPVLATGQVTDQREGKPSVVPTVTLDLLPAEAEKLVLGSSKGSLQLLLRNVMDSAEVNTKGATIAKVLRGTETPAPQGTPAAPAAAVQKRVQPQRIPARPVVVAKAAPPPPSHTLVIIRGTEKSTRQYAE